MWREPWLDEDIIEEYNESLKTNKKIDISFNKPTWNAIWTAKKSSKKFI